MLDDAPSYLVQKFRILQAFLEQLNVVDNANELAGPLARKETTAVIFTFDHYLDSWTTDCLFERWNNAFIRHIYTPDNPAIRVIRDAD